MRKLIVICMYLSLTIPCAAATIYVRASAAGANDGSSWADAYNYLQDALTDANSMPKPLDIWVTEGTYYPDPNGRADPREAAFQMINGVAIYGGFPTGGSDFANRDPNQYETILSGDIGTPDDPNDNCYHVFYHPDGTNLDPNAVLDGFTLTAGNADGSWPHNSGGGMYSYTSSPTVTNCTFTNNSAYNGGGLFNFENSNPVFANCTFTYNSANLRGGGMFNRLQCNPKVTNCTFSNNSVSLYGGGMCNWDFSSPTVTNCAFISNSADYGGGMYNYESSSLTVIGCTFTLNSAESEGGGILSGGGGSPTVSNCAFTENTAGNYGGGLSNYSNAEVTNCTFTDNTAAVRGGGMYNYEGSPIVTNCTFTGNSAGIYDTKVTYGYGGGMLNLYSDPTVDKCTFTDNSALWSGGGMVNWSGDPTVTNCIFIRNSADGYDELGGYGGGMDNGPSDPTVINCTFVGNSADKDGGGMYNYWDSSTTVVNCTFTGNIAENGNAVACDSSNPSYFSTIQMTNCIIWDGANEIWNNNESTITINYSDVQGNWPGLGNINIDPNFVDSGYWDPNDTPGNTNDDFWVDGDYHLKSAGWRWDNDANQWTWDEVTSPCIDAGNPGALLGNEPLTLDVDPLNRWGQNLRINMGAYGRTLQASMPPYDWALLADLTNDGIVNLTDFANQSIDWQQVEIAQPGDLNRDGTVDINDVIIGVSDWLNTTSWY